MANIAMISAGPCFSRVPQAAEFGIDLAYLDPFISVCSAFPLAVPTVCLEAIADQQMLISGKLFRVTKPPTNLQPPAYVGSWAHLWIELTLQRYAHFH